MIVDFLSSASWSFCSSDSPSIRGMLMSDTTRSTCGFCSSDCSASMPSRANMNAYRAVADLPAEFLQYQRLEIGLVIDDEDGVRSCGLLEPCIDFMAQQREIDRLGQKAYRAALDRFPPCFSVAIGRDHDDRNVGPLRPHLRQHLQPAHAGHIDVRQDQDQRRDREFPRRAPAPRAPTEQTPSEIGRRANRAGIADETAPSTSGSSSTTRM